MQILQRHLSGFLVTIALLGTLLASCSSTDAPPTTYPMQLVGTVSKTGNVAKFNLVVTKSGAPVKGARITVRYEPTSRIDTAQSSTDSLGKVNIQVLLGDSVLRVALQAIKDSSLSNYFVYP